MLTLYASHLNRCQVSQQYKKIKIFVTLSFSFVNAFIFFYIQVLTCSVFFIIC